MLLLYYRVGKEDRSPLTPTPQYHGQKSFNAKLEIFKNRKIRTGAPERRGGSQNFQFCIERSFDSTTPKQYTYKPDTMVGGQSSLQLYPPCITRNALHISCCTDNFQPFYACSSGRL